MMYAVLQLMLTAGPLAMSNVQANGEVMVITKLMLRFHDVRFQF